MLETVDPENEGLYFQFIFDQEAYERLHNRIPKIELCSNSAKGVLPPEMNICVKFINYLLLRKDIKPFEQPVPHDDHIAPHYYEIILHPMDVSTVRNKLYAGSYSNISEFKEDIDLIWSNCRTYNPASSEIVKSANLIENEFNKLWDIHNSIDISDAEDILNQIQNINQNVEAAFTNATNFYRMPPRLKLPPIERNSKTIVEKTEDDRAAFFLPSESILATPMGSQEKYELGFALNTLPPELLGKVIEILHKNAGYDPKVPTSIPFSSLDTSTLRTLQAYINQAKEKETSVRRMYCLETIPADKQLEIIDAELKKVNARLAEKRPSGVSSSVSESEEDDSTSDLTTDMEDSNQFDSDSESSE